MAGNAGKSSFLRSFGLGKIAVLRRPRVLSTLIRRHWQEASGHVVLGSANEKTRVERPRVSWLIGLVVLTADTFTSTLRQRDSLTCRRLSRRAFALAGRRP